MTAVVLKESVLSESVSSELWERGARLAEASRQHRFVRKLASGSLPRDAFRVYVGQDAFFLRSFCRGYARAALLASDRMDLVRRLHALMGGVLQELDMHSHYAMDLEVDLATTRPLSGTQAYVDFLEATGSRGDLSRVVAAMVPCMRLYAWIGECLKPNIHPGHPYEDWLKTYSGDEFHALASEVENLLDTIVEGESGAADRLWPDYARALELEAAFWSGPLEVEEQRKP